jgi:D-alanyl-D-alanine carboxypeptidase
MKKKFWLFSVSLQFFFLSFSSFGQTSDLPFKIDSLINTPATKPFNGVILLTKNGKTIYFKTKGYSDLDKKTPLQLNDPFVIGSISKQITAVLLLREVEHGRVNLNAPIYDYLPELRKNWPQDTITVLHLLTHTHGIINLSQPLRFKPGSQFLYSQIGYDLLAKIIEHVSGKPFAEVAQELFKSCNMSTTFHPDYKPKNLINGYTEQADGEIDPDTISLENYAAAGSFISTAMDLNLWNKNVHEGKLLSNKTYQLMITKQKNAVRLHPIFGKTFYGLGLTVDEQDGLLQLGQTGFSPGFVSMDFYYPKTKTSVIVLENIAYNTTDLKQTFFYHTNILKIARETVLSDK